MWHAVRIPLAVDEPSWLPENIRPRDARIDNDALVLCVGRAIRLELRKPNEHTVRGVVVARSNE